MRVSLCLAMLCAACGGGSEQYPPVMAPAPPPEEQRPPPGKLWRDEVDAVVDAGLGRFLQQVEVEPSFASGQFEGFRIVELRPADFWQGVDLRPGDVVLRVNGMPIERETQAFDAFQTLKKSESLRVSARRGAARREISWQIVPRPRSPTAPGSARARNAQGA